ncbi:double-stranded RNA-binding protein 4 isoform X2 [Populus alba]|uniref:DRBM domain-containing protein n=2 Tax=Populus TaxID=3689 RepID=A0A4U5PWA0_POPAL|nr:double-stranded RNA-binding protein 1-like isoform X2 [Populus alba]KAJ6951798.1 double-stranded RNA-binding protein 1-like isoform X2 [Populus alba x Populus x berolinensis]TKS01734.1 hypothetical protein D5086_0000170590 [Populus alba]
MPLKRSREQGTPTMYKSKLQTVCQQRGWELPTYKVTKQGQDHNSLFSATVTVNATTFSTPSPSSSSKKAQSDAAELAYNHFSLMSPSSSSLAGCPGGSAGDNTRPSPGGKSVQDANPTPLSNEAGAVAKTDESFGGMLHFFKNQLQTYAQKRNFSRPVYSCERAGPPHAIRFKCKVTVNGQTYGSREYFPTLNKAENAAAKAALMSLLPNGVEEDESGYKNLLQDMAQREGCGLPTYCTEKSGESHAPTFISTVEINGVSFTGKEARTKKQAEMSAAKIAYTARRR